MIGLFLFLLQSSPDVALVPRGEVVFAQTCSTGYCHGAAGTAGRGPRLRSTGLSRKRILEATRDGVPQSAMPGWKEKLSKEDLAAVVEYVWSLALDEQETLPENPMPPGEGPAAFVGFVGPKRASRGRNSFFDATRQIRCATCHKVDGRGITIGPDLLLLGEQLSSTLIQKTRRVYSQQVLQAKLVDGESFPALPMGQGEFWIKLYDLTSIPPVLRTFLPPELESLTAYKGWSHQSISSEYGDSELEDVIHYLEWINSEKTK